MLKINGLILCQFEETDRGHICKIPSDEGPYVVLDRSNTIEPIYEYGGPYSMKHAVKILTTAKTGRIRFGKIISISLENYFRPLREAVKAMLPNAKWLLGYHGEFAAVDFELEGVFYAYALSKRPHGMIGARSEGDWFLEMQPEATFEFSPDEIGGTSPQGDLGDLMREKHGLK